jgi:adenylate cyclase
MTTGRSGGDGGQRWRSLRLPLLLALLFALLAVGRRTAFVEGIEAKSLDARFVRFAPERHDPGIVLFLLDEASLRHFEKEEGLPWPWPRDVYVAVLDFCRAGGARAVVFDVLFTSRSPCDPAFDETFGKAVGEMPRVVLAADFPRAKGSGKGTGTHLPPRFERFSIPVAGELPAGFPVAAGVEAPVPEILDRLGRLGDVHAEPDPDGVHRRIPLLVRLGGRFYPSLALAAVLAATGESRIEGTPGGIRVGSREIPLDDGTMLVHYRRPRERAGGAGKRDRGYEARPLGNIVLSERSRQAGEPPHDDPSIVRDRIVFVGVSAAGLLDNRPTPISAVFPGVEINATAVDNILNGDHLVRAPEALSLLILLLAVALPAVGSRLARSLLASLVVPAATALLLLAGSVVAFRHGVWIELVAPAAGLVGSLATTSTYSFVVEGRQRRFLRRVLSLYNSDAVVEQIIRDPARLVLGGEKRVVTLYFSDIAGFTSFSESLDPQALVEIMREYLDAMTRTILEEDGTVDKYIGDAIMAFWGAPLPEPDHALRGCRAALRNQRKLDRLRADFVRRGLPPIRARIGLNSGEVSVGNIGSTDRFSYTALGDNVNLASRLEGVNKAYGTGILISEATRRGAGEGIVTREVDLLRVKGKGEAIRIHELLALRGEVPEEELAPYRIFEEGLSSYRQQRWDDAIRSFGRALELRPEDGPARLFLRRTESLVATPPGPDWDGAWTMTEK